MTTPNLDASGGPDPAPAESQAEPLPLRVLRPFVDWVARREASVHVKLLAGFMLIAVLLLALGMFSIAVLGRVDRQVETLTALHDQTELAQDMIYAVTAQSHFRVMSLITQLDSWDAKIYKAKDGFDENLATVRAMSVPAQPIFFDAMEVSNRRFESESMAVSELVYADEIDRALNLHIQVEHETSHELEDQLNGLIAESDQLAAIEELNFESDRDLLTLAVAGFSIVSLGMALFLGAVLSWSLIRPVREVDEALRLIAGGDFDQRVVVHNRDEFGSLTANLNKTTEQLGGLYSDLETLNTDLQETVEKKVDELQRADRLRRYVSPTLADSILAGDTEVALGSSRKYLSIFMSDIRGFTAMTELLEPEHLVAELNEYLEAMTNIVFKHGGTVDKYIGDAILVFFGDPVPQDDHEQRVLRMALEMQDHVDMLDIGWTAKYGASFRVGIGITTGWVTVGNIGSSARSDYTVLGNEVNLASRLADRAEPGEILVSERTMIKSPEGITGEEIDEVTLKGVSRPIKIYKLNRPENGSQESADG